MATRCDQSWPGGLRHGILIECQRMVPTDMVGHTGKHSNHDEHMLWYGGRLTYQEEEWRDVLRERNGTADGHLPL